MEGMNDLSNILNILNISFAYLRKKELEIWRGWSVNKLAGFSTCICVQNILSYLLMKNNTELTLESVEDSTWNQRQLKNLWRFKVHCRGNLLSRLYSVMSQEREEIGASPLKDHWVAPYVIRLLCQEVNWTAMQGPTLGRSHSVVQNVTNHSADQTVWRLMKESTLVRTPSDAQSVTNHSVEQVI